MERIDFIDHSAEPPELIASFFWSAQAGLRSTNTFLMGEIERHGILLPNDEGVVFPRDGRRCFDALRWRGSSFIEVTAPRVVTGEAGAGAAS